MTSSSRKLITLAATMAFIGPLAGALALSNSAMAADMLADQNYEYTEVEFGTGWYLRGDIGGGLSSVNVSTSFGGGNIDMGSPVSIGIAAGYTYAEGLRAEFAFNHFNNLSMASRSGYPSCGTEDHDNNALTPPIPVTGSCFFSANAQVSASNIMANAYADLGTYWGIRPYVGVGLGMAYMSWNNFSYTDYCEGGSPIDCGGTGVGRNVRDSGSYTTEGGLTYAANAMLGVSYDLTKDWTLDLGYRFSYFGEAGVARAASNPGTFEDITVGNITMHEIRLGFRYEIW
jgi:opacity protein-like surface antigen